MPTFNQLVKKGRQTSVKKSTAPALQKGFNSLKKKPTDTASHRREVFVQQLRLQLLKSLTQLFVKSPEFVCQTESK